MGEQMQFPKTLDEFIEQYSFIDHEMLYTNGSELIQAFRVKQWEEHKQNEVQQLKDRIEKANILIKKIKDDIYEKMAECYENEDNWNGDFLNIEINSIDRLLKILKKDNKEKVDDN